MQTHKKTNKKIIKVGEFEFIILVIIAEKNPRLVDLINNLNKRYKKKFSVGYLSGVMKRLREAELVIRTENHYFLSKEGGYYLELYNKL